MGKMPEAQNFLIPPRTLCKSRRKENDCAKKESNKQKNKKRISFKESTTKLSDKRKSLSYLDYLQAVQSFYSSDRDLYSRTLVFFFQSEVTSMQVNTLQGN